jgi:hypothetical protein
MRSIDWRLENCYQVLMTVHCTEQFIAYFRVIVSLFSMCILVFYNFCMMKDILSSFASDLSYRVSQFFVAIN